MAANAGVDGESSWAESRIRELEGQLRQTQTERDEALKKIEALRQIPPPLIGRWHHGNGVIVCGTIRVAREDFDTQPSEQFRKEFWDWVCASMDAVVKIQKG